MLKDKLNDFVSGIKECDKIEAALLYGSTVINQKYGWFDDVSDIDIIICTASTDFRTPQEAYFAIARSVKNKIKPTIKSIQEFSPNNYVTMNRRYIQHLYNIGEVIYEKENVGLKEKLDSMWCALRNDAKVDIAYKTAPALIVRHRLLELDKGIMTKILSDDGQTIDRPTKYFWQSAMDVLNVDILPEEEGDIVKKFYKIIPSGDPDDINRIRGQIKDINNRIMNGTPITKVQGGIRKIYAEFKEIVERDMWALNNYLLSAPE